MDVACRRLLTRFVLAITVVAGTVVSSMSAAAAPPTAIFNGELPSPFVSGHAPLYGWGVATLPDGSLAIGDIWNRRVVHYAVDGTSLGVLFNLVPQGRDFRVKRCAHEAPLCEPRISRAL